jgi:hypothetical protein
LGADKDRYACADASFETYLDMVANHPGSYEPSLAAPASPAPMPAPTPAQVAAARDATTPTALLRYLHAVAQGAPQATRASAAGVPHAHLHACVCAYAAAASLCVWMHGCMCGARGYVRPVLPTPLPAPADAERALYAEPLSPLVELVRMVVVRLLTTLPTAVADEARQAPRTPYILRRLLASLLDRFAYTLHRILYAKTQRERERADVARMLIAPIGAVCFQTAPIHNEREGLASYASLSLSLSLSLSVSVCRCDGGRACALLPPPPLCSTDGEGYAQCTAGAGRACVGHGVHPGRAAARLSQRSRQARLYGDAAPAAPAAAIAAPLAGTPTPHAQAH